MRGEGRIRWRRRREALIGEDLPSGARERERGGWLLPLARRWPGLEQAMSDRTRMQALAVGDAPG